MYIPFSTAELQCATKLGPVGKQEKLKRELFTVYRHPELLHAGKTSLSLLKSLYENNL
jgi:hypothetical protein